MSHYAARRTGRLWIADFTTLPPGACPALPGMLAHTRASGATVQTGTSAIVSGLGTDVAGIGRALDADALGLVIEEARTNECPVSDPYTWSRSDASATHAIGPDGAVSALEITDSSATGLGYAVRDITKSTPSAVYTGSQWYCDVSGAVNTKIGVNPNNTVGGMLVTRPIPAGWRRNVGTGAVSSTPSGNFVVIPAYPGVADVGAARFAFAQFELGSFATEAIPTTGAAATRSGARVWHPYAPMLVDRGRLSMEIRFRPKGARSQYPAAKGLFFVPGGPYDQSYVSAGGGLVVQIAGASWTHSTALDWAANDVVDLWLEAGGGAMQSVMKYRRNGGSVTTLVSSAPQASIDVAGGYQRQIDLLNFSNTLHFSSRVERLATYAQGCRPEWAS